ncbi:MAG: UvrD-helicase domain-containing protein [Betaproteobacteria bacterium]
MPKPERNAPPDSEARRAALDVTHSFIVQAPAGSGKTELLIQRFLALLARVERPEAIVAMTFTRKAAGEIRERIVAALRVAGSVAMPNAPHRAVTWRLARAVLDRDAALGWDLVAHPARLQIQTIDALCTALMRQAPLAIKLGAMPRLIEGAAPLYAQAARAELDAAGSDIAWQRLLDYLDNDGERLVDLIAQMLARREQWLRHVITDDVAALRGELEQTLAAEIADRLAAVAAAMPASATSALVELARYAAGNLIVDDAAHPLAAWMALGQLPDTGAGALEHWRAIADWLLTKDGRFLTSIKITKGFPRRGPVRSPGAGERGLRKQAMAALLRDLDAIPGLAAALHGVRRLPPPHYDDSAWLFTEALLQVLPRAAARLQLVFAQAGAIDFTEASLIALRALGDTDTPSDLLLRLDMRIEHLLVDEFQDTSLLQYQLVERLIAGWAQGDGRTLFVVGDPMQSIYGFREAEVGLYLDAQRQRRLGGVALELLNLQCNFRTQCELVDWVNRVFAQVLGAEQRSAEGAIAFSAATAVLPAETPPAVTLDARTTDAEEAATVVAHVRAALAGGAEEIAVLVRKRGDLAQILPALRAAGIAFAAVELDRMAERQAILDLTSLTHALIQPADRLAWLAILRAPWCGLTLPDVFALVGRAAARPLSEAILAHADEGGPSGLSGDGAVRLQRLAAVIGPALAERGRLPLATAVRGVSLALGGPACVAEPSDLDAAERFFALLAEQSEGSDLPDWNAFVDALAATYAEGGGAGAKVRVMTLHRAKGLEFGVVIMPGLARRPRGSTPQLLRWRRRFAGLLLAPIAARVVGHPDVDPVYAYLQDLATAAEAAELNRLLYVGCTRAKRRLHLTAVLSVEPDANGHLSWRRPARGTSLAALWPALENELPPPKVSTSQPMPSHAAAGVPLSRLPLDWRAPGLPRPLPTAPRAAAVEKPAVEFDWVRETARQIGIVAHRLLRQCAEEGRDRWPPERIAAQRGRVVRELAGLGFTGDEAESAARQVLGAVSATLADVRGRWLFDPRHTDARSEYALTGVRNGVAVHVVLDRSFIDAEGVRWIIDFKLSRHEGAGRETFLDSEQARYEPQLEAYAEVARGLGAHPIRLGLYFPLLAGWREWEPSH